MCGQTEREVKACTSRHVRAQPGWQYAAADGNPSGQPLLEPVCLTRCQQLQQDRESAGTWNAFVTALMFCGRSATVTPLGPSPLEKGPGGISS